MRIFGEAAFRQLTSSALLLLLSTTWASAQQIPGEDYILKQSDYNPVIKQLTSRLAKSAVDLILDNAHYGTEEASQEMKDTPWFIKGWRWAGQDWHNDGASTFWRPKGIATTADAGQEVFRKNSEIMMVAWNDIRNETGRAVSPSLGVRVSFVRKGSADAQVANKGYTHVLLVEPFMDEDNKPNFRALTNVESGGMVWRGKWIYITDKALGVRVFDLDNILAIATGEHIGRNFEGKWGAGQYRYVVPQAYTYTPVSAKAKIQRPTVLSVDRNATTPRLMIGETVPITLEHSSFAAYPFNTSTDLLAVNATGYVHAEWAWRTNVRRVTGMVYSPPAKAYYFIQSFGDDTRGNVLKWMPGSWSDEYDETLPPGPEGAAVRPDQEELWILGGKPGDRYVMALSAKLQEMKGYTPPDTGKSDPANTNPPIEEESVEPEKEKESAAISLSPGVIAGIAIGVLAFLCSSALSVYLFLRLRRRKKPAEPPHILKPELDDTAVARPSFQPPSDASGESQYAKEVYWADSVAVHELPGETWQYEMPAATPAGESSSGDTSVFSVSPRQSGGTRLTPSPPPAVLIPPLQPPQRTETAVSLDVSAGGQNGGSRALRRGETADSYIVSPVTPAVRQGTWFEA